MRKLDELMEQLGRAKEAVSEAEDRLNEYLKPIIKAHEGIDRVWGGFHDMCRYSDGTVCITFRDDARGGPYDKDYKIHTSVFDKADADAIEAARLAREARENKKKAEQRASDEAQFEALRIKLGK